MNLCETHHPKSQNREPRRTHDANKPKTYSYNHEKKHKPTQRKNQTEMENPPTRLNGNEIQIPHSCMDLGLFPLKEENTEIVR